MTTVELHPAWVWDCDTCGRENVARGITLMLTAEEAREMAERCGDEIVGEQPPPGVRCPITSAPNEVRCRHCNAEFDVELPDG